MPLPLLTFLLFLALHLAIAYEDHRWVSCAGATNYTANSTYSANLGQALDNLRNSTALTSFNATTVGTGTQTITALALCRADLTQLDCQACVDGAALGIHKQCPWRTTAEIWYNFCMLRYSDTNFLTMSDNSISFLIWDTRNVPEQDIYDQRVQVLIRNLSISAGESLKRYALGWTRVTDTLTLYGYVECTRDLRGEDCSRCLLTAIGGIERCCLGKWAGWIGTPSCAIRFNMDPLFNDSAAAPQIFTDPPSSPPPPRMTVPEIQTVVKKGGEGKRMVVGASAAVVGTVILGVGCLWLWVVMKGRRRKKMKRSGNRNEEHVEEVVKESMESRNFLFDLEILTAATDNFSPANRLGSGGFGAVYKGIMHNGEEIAVKKLAVGSMQGTEQFANEIRLLLKIQHRNLVKLFGCCIQGEEKMLIYEYLLNKSLDHFIFDKSRSGLLDWPKRLNIIVGIAKGLLYLHQDSQYKIIHRDIKASNILLDEQMTPKISDFGLAKLFPDERTHVRTRRIVGTIGYMAPEYAIRGFMSTKSDVYSFGVLMLEIISGRKNYDLQLDEHGRELLNLTWRLNQQGRLMNLVDVTMGSFPQDEVVKCIQIGLLCCQEIIQERPIMSSIVFMLSNNLVTVPPPGRPGYQGSRENTIELSTTTSSEPENLENENFTRNSITTSSIIGR